MQIKLGRNKAAKELATIYDLPPNITMHIFSFLPVPYLPLVASVSRRWKVLAYRDEVYILKLQKLGMVASILVEHGFATSTETVKESLISVLRLKSGGQYLPVNGVFPELDVVHEAPPALLPLNGVPVDPYRISVPLPEPKSMKLIIGSESLKAVLARTKPPAGLKKVPSNQELKSRNQCRAVFRKVYTNIYSFYVDFVSNTNNSLVFQTFQDLSEIGAVLSCLKLFDGSKFLARSTQKISSNLLSTIKWFESRLLNQFDAAYSSKDVIQMQINAYAAFQLNRGFTCINLFISKNPVFFDRTFNPSNLETRIPPLTTPPMGPLLGEEFGTFANHLLDSCYIQAETMAKAFVPDTHAINLFMDKVFDECIHGYLIALLNIAKTHEGAAIFLNTLSTAAYCCYQLVFNLEKKFGPMVVDLNGLKSRVKEIFLPYLDTYLEQENDLLKARFKAEIDKWEEKRLGGRPEHDAVEKKHGFGLVSSMKAIVLAPAALVKAGLGGMGRKGASQPLLNDVAQDNLTAQLAVEPPKKEKIEPEIMSSLVSIPVGIVLMHINKEHLTRVLIMTANTDINRLRPAIQTIFCTFLKVVGTNHLKPAFSMYFIHFNKFSAIEKLAKSAPMDFGEGNKLINMDSLQFFDLIHVGDMMQQMVQGYYQEDVKLWIDEQDFLSEIIIEKKAFERLLDDSVAGGMDKAIQVLINQCEFLLVSGHGLNDFNKDPKEIVMDFKVTKACEQVVTCLEAHTKTLKGCIEKETMEVFLGEVSVRLFHVIIKNIRRLQVSQTGAMQLICDLNRYYDWAYSLRMQSATKMFQALKEVGSIFLADGSEELKAVVHDLPRFNGALRLEEIYELLQSRTDYKMIRTQVEAKDCVIQ